jgi:hypothetical protein
MAKFDGKLVVAEALDWDFTELGVAASGTIPEPSDQKIGDFLDGLKALYTEAGELLPSLAADASAEQMLEALSNVTGKQFVKLMADVAGLFAKLCGSQPSKAQLLALPMRYRVHFYAWVNDEVVNPEAGTGAGTAAVKPLRSAAAG